jgi:hypothetical protein
MWLWFVMGVFAGLVLNAVLTLLYPHMVDREFREYLKREYGVKQPDRDQYLDYLERHYGIGRTDREPPQHGRKP